MQTSTERTWARFIVKRGARHSSFVYNEYAEHKIKIEQNLTELKCVSLFIFAMNDTLPTGSNATMTLQIDSLYGNKYFISRFIFM